MNSALLVLVLASWPWQGQGSLGDCFRSNGTGAVPTFQACPSGGAGTDPTKLVTTADFSNSTAVFLDVPELTLAVTAGTYYVDCSLVLTSAVTTTAPQLSLNGPAASLISWSVAQATAATTAHFSSRTAFNTVVNAATGPAAVLLPARINGTITFTASGTFAVRVRSEVDTSVVTVKAGSYCIVHN
jgi:hypothetical protein